MNLFTISHWIIDPVFTPFNDDGSINHDQIKNQADLCEQVGVNAIFVCGTTGECMSLTIVERKLIAELWKKYINPSIKIIIHVGCQSLIDTKDLARHAQYIGVDGIAAISPSYFKPSNINGLIDYMKEIALCANEIPFYYYHFPGMTNVNISAYNFLKNASDVIPNLKGIKYTHIDMEDFSKCISFNNYKYDIWTGYGLTMGLPGMIMGSRGTFSYTYHALFFKKLIDEYKEKNISECAKIQHKMVELNSTIMEYGGLVAAKVIYDRIIPCGNVRLPLNNNDVLNNKNTFLNKHGTIFLSMNEFFENNEIPNLKLLWFKIY